MYIKETFKQLISKLKKFLASPTFRNRSWNLAKPIFKGQNNAKLAITQSVLPLGQNRSDPSLKSVIERDQITVNLKLN